MANPQRYYITSEIREKGPFIVINEDNVFNSYGICSFKLTKPNVDLKHVRIETSLTKEYTYEYPRKFNISLFYKNQKMLRTKLMGQGSYGKVWKYEVLDNKNENISLALKIPTENIEEEPLILENLLNENICNKSIIPIKTIFDKHDNPFIIMQEANSSLRSLKPDERLVKKIIYQITKDIECFYNYDIFYLDLKTENILYRCDNDKISIFLGDIGSFSELGNESMATFMPPEALNSKHPKADKAYMFFTLGAFYADLYGLADDIYYENDNGKWKTKKSFIEVHYPKFVKKIINSNVSEKLKDVILQFTQIDPVARSKLNFSLVYEIFE